MDATPNSTPGACPHRSTGGQVDTDAAAPLTDAEARQCA